MASEFSPKLLKLAKVEVRICMPQIRCNILFRIHVALYRLQCRAAGDFSHQIFVHWLWSTGHGKRTPWIQRWLAFPNVSLNAMAGSNVYILAIGING